jgi:acetyl esterase/lipase
MRDRGHRVFDIPAAEKYNIDPEKVFAVGFSAGGHLTASLGTMWSKKEIYEEIDMPFGYNKPKGMILMYPVTTPFSHLPSFKNLLRDENPTEDALDMCDISKHIDENSSPAFIFHTSNDDVVNVRGSLKIADILAEKGIKFELHIYPDGPHGIALANKITSYDKSYENPALEGWISDAVTWAKNLD